ncbi:uncharacterized protein LOC116264636 [Nymphaea colorata]|uniref:uncharacterized protein LOC116264636 n=1 Tax=Nymphaea colorata TaxID=210225 RepID=UPI00129EDB79|nr:uncharacterized protein LOC116264636 [Nymphaea colorata]
MENESKRKRSAEEAECGEDEAKRLRSDILGLLEEDVVSDDTSESESTSEELLNSVMRSLQDEIDGDDAASRAPAASAQPDLGYLLEATDDELGLPPAGCDDVPRIENDGALGEVPGFVGFWDFEEGIPGFAVEEFWFPGGEARYGGEEAVVLDQDGLFDYSDASVPADFSSMGLWRHETMPAL